MERATKQRPTNLPSRVSCSRVAGRNAVGNDGTGNSQKLEHSKHGFEAPRNSFDISIDKSEGYHCLTEDIPYSFQVKQHSSEMSHLPDGTSMKKLMHGPNLVARLMGIESIPSERSTKIPDKEHEVDRSRKAMEMGSKPMDNSSGLGTPCSSTSSRHTKTRRPQPREHPQEELLQRFKKEFLAWQASKSWEHPRSKKSHHVLGDGKDRRARAPKNLDSQKSLAEKKTTQRKAVVSPARRDVNAQGSSSSSSKTMKLGRRINGPEHFPVAKTDRQHDRTCSPTQIVILKPNCDRSDDNEESLLAASSDELEKECSMEDFLEEVKERLRKEAVNVKGRGNRVETPSSERPSDPKQIARGIARHTRESVTKDRGTTLVRSESTRSTRSDIQIKTPDSPEFIRRDTRKFLSAKSKNILKDEILLGDSGAFSLIRDTAMPEQGKSVDYWKDKKAVIASIPRKREKSVAQRNLIRSLSAPVSGTAFGKLLSEDQHITGAQIRRKHEASEHNLSEVGNRRKDGLNQKGRVSNLKHSFNLKGKFFGKKTELLIKDQPAASGFHTVKETPTAPPAFTSAGIITQENSTEVPPSPASVCSGSPDEFCRQGSPSPVSPLEVMEYHTTACTSEALSSGAPARISLPDPHLSEQAEHGGSEMAATEQPDQASSRSDAATRPISPQVFEEEEEAYGKCWKSSVVRNDDTAIRHKLLFDLVNEALQSVLGPQVHCSMFKRRSQGQAAPPQAKSLLLDLWNQIQVYMSPPLHESDVNNVVVQDVKTTTTTTWPSMLHEDVDVVGRQIERVVLRDLIDDIVQAMIVLPSMRPARCL
ncbi:hypothetical protein OPV22_012246 [Ensete ventricosum]|uniref:DUF4378 domain-containing protein n=1 Tax=Ensete ventricosum TaxID=4639 RepID=A0AAV8R5N7_ENSVE|nr:hypothetical protein OPV22_012246 [Ensete ventricosum]